MRRLVLAALASGCLSPALADGAAVFAEACAACHNEGGIGTPGLAPALNRAGFWAGLGDKAPDYIAAVMVSGLSGRIMAGSEMYIGAMPPVAGYEDADLAAAATYVLTDLGGLSAEVTPEMIAAHHASPTSHGDLRAMRPEGE